MAKSLRLISTCTGGVATALTLCLGTWISATALAQSASSPEHATEKLEEILVTAQRRVEDIQTVPMSVSVVSGARIEDFGLKDLGDVLQAVPGVVLSNNIPGEGTVSMRGVSATAGAGTVSFMLDDVALPDTGSGALSNTSLQPVGQGAFNPQLLDIDRVEVLRGPQGTLFGVSSMGGTIRFVTTQPQLDRFEGSVAAELGATDYGAGPDYNSTVIANIPLLADSVAARAAISAGSLAGITDRLNDAGELQATHDDKIDNVAARLTTLVRLSDTLTITPMVLYQENRLDDIPYYDSSLPNFEKYANFPAPQVDISRLGALTIKKDFRSAELVSVTSYMDREVNQNPGQDYGPFLYSVVSGILVGMNPSYAPVAVPYLRDIDISNVQYTNSINYSQEIRLTSTDKDDRLQWLLGGLASHLRSNFQQKIISAGFDGIGNKYLVPVLGSNPFLLGSNPFDNKDDFLFASNIGNRYSENGLFANAAYRVTSKLTVAAGVRWYSEEELNTTWAGGLLDAGPGTYLQYPSLESSDHGYNPRYTINYQVTPSNFLYASAAKGFRAGGGNGTIPNNPGCNADEAGYSASTGKSALSNYLPDYVWSYEFGSKNKLFSDRLTVNATFFYLQWLGIQEFLDLQNYGNQVCPYGIIANIGSAFSRGGELELQARVTDGLTVGLSGAYVDARVTSPSDEGAPQGAPLPDVPQLSGDLNLTYLHPLPRGLTLVFNASEDYEGNQVRDFVPNSGVHYLSHYAVADLRLGVQRDNWQVSLFARNLFNSAPVLNDAIVFSPGIAAVAAGIPPYNLQSTLRPRSVGVAAKMTF
jgi:iron complex outermembrane receptor protein